MRARHRLAFVLALAFAAGWLLLLAAAVFSARSPAAVSGEVLVLFPPSLGGADARGRIFQAGGLPLGRIVPPLWRAYSDAPGFAGRLEDRGALLVLPALDGLGGFAMCGTGLEFVSARADRNVRRGAALR